MSLGEIVAIINMSGVLISPSSGPLSSMRWKEAGEDKAKEKVNISIYTSRQSYKDEKASFNIPSVMKRTRRQLQILGPRHQYR